MTPRLALIPGEPAGIGPELCVRLAQQDRDVHWVALADPDTLLAAANALNLPLQLCDAGAHSKPGQLAIQPIVQAHPTQFGQPDPANASAVIAALKQAGEGCLSGQYHGMITGPVHKANINAGGIAYTGTTELLAAQAGVEVVMMLANPQLRVALATTHLPLRAVADAISIDGLTRTLRILHQALQHHFGIQAPRIGVLGLNPHAGEQGLLGHEEITVITPVLSRLRAEGLSLVGPLPADTAFLPRVMAEFDAVLAMYHDQGLPVLKHANFEQAVNVTLGLPYPRVAVDHGTALDLAGRGLANPGSLFAAAELCARMAHRRMTP